MLATPPVLTSGIMVGIIWEFAMGLWIEDPQGFPDPSLTGGGGGASEGRVWQS